MGTPPGSLLALALVATLVADQAVKQAVVAAGRGALVALGGSVRVGPARTSPTVAGRLRVPLAAHAAVWLACLVAVLVAGATGRFGGAVAQVALGAALGGAAGNLVDVVMRRGVVDYLAVGRWPACNLADVAIVAGVAGALVAG